MAFDLSRDRSFALNTAQLTAAATSGGSGFTYGGITSTLVNPAQTPTLNYTFASQESAVVFSNGAPKRYLASEISLRDTDRLVYQATDGLLTIGQPGPLLGGFPSGLRYVVLALQNVTTRNSDGSLDIVERRSTAGASTVASDVPRSGAATFRVLLTSMAYAPSAVNGFTAQDATLAIDYATRSVTGMITAASTVSNSPSRSITFTVAGQVSGSSNRISGSLSSSGGGTGLIAGDLYGPAGVELGLAFTFEANGEQIIGTIVGAKR